MKKLILLTVMLMLLSSLTLAIQGDIKLLAAKEGGGGSVANLHLEIQEGTGRVFMDTQPLTKLDTLISTRFANRIACDFLEKDCSKYDFFYTITADSSIVGGPSAGSAISALTAALLDGKSIPEDVAITGTINSGGFIGSVGSVKDKVEIAAEQGIKKVLIPIGDSQYKVNNTTQDLTELGAELDIEVLEVQDLNLALLNIIGKRYWPEYTSIEVPEDYKDTMMKLAQLLCKKTQSLQQDLLNHDVKDPLATDYIERENRAINYTVNSEKAFGEENYYSAASYCYGANVAYRELLFLLTNQSIDFEIFEKELDKFDSDIDNKPIETMTDLQAYMVVKERVSEARSFLNLTLLRIEMNDSDYKKDLAVAVERLYSARTWAEFFNKPGNRFVFDQESLKTSCLNKIAEAEERFQYVNTIIPLIHKSAKDELDFAQKDLDSENYVMCLFRAGKAKAETDTFINSLGIEEDQIGMLIDKKLDITKQSIAKQIDKGNFPILGYSYYEYSKDLKESDEYSSLLFSEYALEMSNLDAYFKRVDSSSKFSKINIQLSTNARLVLMLVAGLCIGFAFGVLYLRQLRIYRRSRRRSKK